MTSGSGAGHPVRRWPDELLSVRQWPLFCVALPRVGGLCARLPGCEVERLGMRPAVVLGQDLGEGAGPVRDGAVADLAAGDRQLGNGHRESAGR